MLKKLLIGTAALATVGLPIAASAHPYGHDYDHRGRWGGGAAVAAGLFGLAIGAAIASSHHSDYDDYGYRYGYGYDDGYAPYAVRCHWETRAYPGPWGQVTYENVRVCY